MKIVRLLILLVGLACCKELHAESCKVALVQAHLTWGDVSANLDAFDARMSQCADCDMIVLPELFTVGCEMKGAGDKAVVFQSKDEVASLFPKVLKQMQAWASRSGALVVGSTIYKENGRYYNRLLAVFPDGNYQHYDKHNCFKKGAYSPGNAQLIVAWKGHRIATYICYDLRFADWSRNEGQYDTALYIANWPESRRDDWQNLLKERAIENRAYIIGVNCSGTDPFGKRYAGDSMLVAPDGEVRVQGTPYQDEVLKVVLE